MNLWQTIGSATDGVLRGLNGTLRWTESITPWPLSLLPRTLRLPLDIIATVAAGRPAESPTAAAPTVATPTNTAPRSSAAMPPRKARTTTPEHAAPAAEPLTVGIAGARSNHDTTTRYDREFRARLAPLYTRDAGKGPSIVLLHAFPLNSRMWEPQLDELAGRFRVLAPDLAGFGLSWTPDASFSLADQASAVEATLDDLRIDELVLVGLSLGGYVAFPLLERLGARVRGLVLASTRATADDERTAADRHRLAAEIEVDGVDVVASELLPKLLGESATRDQPELVDRVHAMILENREAGVANALRAMASRPDWSTRLGRIACPVLVITGTEDLLVSRESTRRMAAQMHDARIERLRAGHLVNLEATDEFNRTIADFAATVGRHGGVRARAAQA